MPPGEIPDFLFRAKNKEGAPMAQPQPHFREPVNRGCHIVPVSEENERATSEADLPAGCSHMHVSPPFGRQVEQTFEDVEDGGPLTDSNRRPPPYQCRTGGVRAASPG